MFSHRRDRLQSPLNGPKQIGTRRDQVPVCFMLMCGVEVQDVRGSTLQARGLDVVIVMGDGIGDLDDCPYSHPFIDCPNDAFASGFAVHSVDCQADRFGLPDPSDIP